MLSTDHKYTKDDNVCSGIHVDDVYKSFGTHHVLNGVDFRVEAGETVALLGHNGAGKTTLLRIMLGLLDVDSGNVNVFGQNPLFVGENIRKISGVLSEDTGLYESLTVYDNLKFFAEIYGCSQTFYEKRIEELLKKFDIIETKNQIIKNFSMGMKKKVAIIRTILHNPKLVLFDEPVNSLDPVSINMLHDIMREMKKEYNTTFVITTHNLDEVMKICDKIVIVKGGKSVVQTKLDMDAVLKTHIELMEPFKTDRVEAVMSKFDLDFTIKGNELIIDKTDKRVISEIIKELIYNQLAICSVMRDRFDLSKIYMEAEEESNG